jgi:hypothetical protein
MPGGWTGVSAGWQHSCAISFAIGTLHCWGSGERVCQFTPTSPTRCEHSLDLGQSIVPANYTSSKFLAAAAGYAHTCGIVEEPVQLKTVASPPAQQSPPPAPPPPSPRSGGQPCLLPRTPPAARGFSHDARCLMCAACTLPAAASPQQQLWASAWVAPPSPCWRWLPWPPLRGCGGGGVSTLVKSWRSRSARRMGKSPSSSCATASAQMASAQCWALAALPR